MTGLSPPSWHPDPFGRHDLRYWDGGRWTEHVSSRGLQGTDAPVPDARPAVGKASVRRDVERAGVLDGRSGGGTLFTEPVLVVNQKPKVFDSRSEYLVYDRNGVTLGTVQQLGPGVLRAAVTPTVRHRRRRLRVLDQHGRLVLQITRSAAVVKSTVTVHDASGQLIGQVVQKSMGIVGNVKFVLQSQGQDLATLEGEGWSTWDFAVKDGLGSEVARITRGRGGLATSLFRDSKRDKYVAEISDLPQGPLRTLAVASCIAIDTALRDS